MNEEILKNEIFNLNQKLLEKEILIEEQKREIIYLKNSVENDEKNKLLQKITNQLDCIEFKDIPQYIINLKHEILQLNAEISNNNIFGNKLCPNCKLLEEKIENISLNNKEITDNLIQNYKNEIIDLQISIKSTINENNSLKINIKDLEEEKIKINNQNNLLKIKNEEIFKELNEKNGLFFELKRNIREKDLEISNIKSELEISLLHHNELLEKEKTFNEFINLIIKKLNKFKNNLIIKSLINIFLTLSEPENKKIPNFNEFINLINQNQIPINKFEIIFNKINFLNEKINFFEKKFKNLIEIFQEKNEIIYEFEKEDLAPKVSFLLNKIKKLEKEISLFQIGSNKIQNNNLKNFLNSPGEEIFESIIQKKNKN